jgi:hypothetical protein
VRGVPAVVVSVVVCGCVTGGPIDPGTARLPTTIVLVPDTPLALPNAGDTVRISAIISDEHGIIHGGSVLWTSSKSAIALVLPPSGTSTLVTAVHRGDATVTASAGNAVSLPVVVHVMQPVTVPAR